MVDPPAQFAFVLCASIVAMGCGSSSTDNTGDASVDAASIDVATLEDAAPPPQDASPPPKDAGPTCPTSVKAPTAFTGANSDPSFLQVYVNNVENLELPADPCPGEWKDLFYYMKLHPSPDVFLVQQISGKQQLDMLAQYMTANLPGTFEGIVTESNPEQMNSPCGPPKDYQTNAIIYRTERLQPVGSVETFQVQSFYGGACKKNFQSRTIAVMHRFHDKLANKNVTVASMHWSTFEGTGADPACAEQNVVQMANELQKSGPGADLLIFGGDANESDRNAQNKYRDWYQMANGDLGGKLGFRDAIFSLCDEQSGPVKACLDDNWTGGNGGRIDFLWAKRGDGCLPMLTGQHTITFQEGDAAAKQLTGTGASYNYSGHRAVQSQVHY